MPMNPRLLRPRQTGFDPRSISALAAWYDASDAASVTLNAGNVSEWRDKSGNNRHATQGTALNQPAWLTNQRNGRAAITWDGTRFLTTSAFPLLPHQFGVAVVSFAATNSAVFQRGTVNDVHSLFSETTLRSRVGSGAIDSTAAFSANTFYVLSWQTFTPQPSGTATSLLRVNGVASSQASATLSTSTTDRALTIGGLSSSVYRMNGTICEILYCQGTSAATASQVTSLERYASRKWGVTLP